MTTKKRPASVKKSVAPKKAKTVNEPAGERRTSRRQRMSVKYVETGDSTDDERMDIEDHVSDSEMVEEIVVA